AALSRPTGGRGACAVLALAMVDQGSPGGGLAPSPHTPEGVSRPMSRTIWAVLAVLALAFAALTGLAVKRGLLGPAQQTVAIGGPFHLTDQQGRPLTEAALKGKWSAVFFGYTFCPEACPTTLFALGQTETKLGPKAADFQTVFISVDPERDNPK